MLLQNPDQILCTVRTGSKAGLFRHGQPTAHLVRSLKKFEAFLWQIAPIVPVLPTPPAYKPFAVNKVRVERHLHTVEVVGSKSCSAHHQINKLQGNNILDESRPRSSNDGAIVRLRALVCGLPPPKRRSRRVMVFKAFFDDSGSGPPVFVLSGYVSNIDFWE
jgi:hypothetical protein